MLYVSAAFAFNNTRVVYTPNIARSKTPYAHYLGGMIRVCFRVVDDAGNVSFDYRHYLIKSDMIYIIMQYIKHGLQT